MLEYETEIGEQAIPVLVFYEMTGNDSEVMITGINVGGKNAIDIIADSVISTLEDEVKDHAVYNAYREFCRKIRPII